MDAMLVRFWLLMLFIMEMLEGRLSEVCMDVGALMVLCMVLCMLRADCVRPMVLGWVACSPDGPLRLSTCKQSVTSGCYT